MTKDIGAAAIGLAVETIQNTIAIEQENKNLKDQLSSNLKLMDDFEVVIPILKGSSSHKFLFSTFFDLYSSITLGYFSSVIKKKK